MSTQQQSSLRALRDGAKPYTSVCEKAADGTMTRAIVTSMEDGRYWARLYVGGTETMGTRIHDDVAGLVALLAETGIPVESGWERWQAQAY